MQNKSKKLAIYCPKLNELCVDGGRYVAVPPTLTRLARNHNDEVDTDIICWWARETRVIDTDCSVGTFIV